MNIQVLHSAIQNPSKKVDLDLKELEQLIGDYPYFPAAHMLLAQLYQNRGDHRFTDQLHNASAYSANRKLLREMIRSSVIQNAIVEEEIPEIRMRVSEQPLQEGNVLPDASEIEIIVSVPEPLPVEIISAEVESPAEHSTEIALDDVTKEILARAVSSSIEKEVEEDANGFRKEPKELKPQSSTAPSAEKPLDLTYESWLTWRAEQIHFGESASTEPSTSPIEFDDSRPSIAHGKTRIQTDRKEQQRSIIDRFIQSEPRIASGRADEFEIGDVAKASLEDDMSFVTETMAKLYVQQGRPDKARKVYQKLMELHPEKSIYFAALLKNTDKSKK